MSHALTIPSRFMTRKAAIAAGVLALAGAGVAASVMLRSPAHDTPTQALSSVQAEPTAKPQSSKPQAAVTHNVVPDCASCGVVESVRAIKQKGDATGLGAVAGGVVGGALGHQMGNGNGRTAMTVLGAVGGGVAGNEIEKQARSETWYEVRVRMDNGTVRMLTQKTAPTAGTRVTVKGGVLKVAGPDVGARNAPPSGA